MNNRTLIQMKGRWTRLIQIILCSGMILFIVSCGQKEYQPDAFITFIEGGENGLVKSRSFGNNNFQLKYQPPAYLAAKQIAVNDAHSVSFDELQSTYKKSSHYILRLENTEGKPVVRGMVNSMEEYQDLIQYLAFSIKEDVRLYTSSDTISCQFSHFERNYDLAPYAQVQLGFTLPNEEYFQDQDISEWVVEFDAHRMGLGPIKFRYNNSQEINNPLITL